MALGKRRTAFYLLLFLALNIYSISCRAAEQPAATVHTATEPARYLIKRTTGPITIDSRPDEDAWARADTAEINQFPWTQHEFYPKTTVKALYDDARLYLLFECQEKYIHASHTEPQSAVFRDNCVELFASPSSDLSKPYLNFEFNCLGTILLQCGYQISDRTNASLEEIAQIECKATFEEPVEQQDESVKTWYLEAAIPFSLFTEYTGAPGPRSGDVWRGNFNKCAVSTREKHWATWSRVGTPKPHFHKSEYFGQLAFE